MHRSTDPRAMVLLRGGTTRIRRSRTPPRGSSRGGRGCSGPVRRPLMSTPRDSESSRTLPSSTTRSKCRPRSAVHPTRRVSSSTCSSRPVGPRAMPRKATEHEPAGRRPDLYGARERSGARSWPATQRSRAGWCSMRRATRIATKHSHPATLTRVRAATATGCRARRERRASSQILSGVLHLVGVRPRRGRFLDRLYFGSSRVILAVDIAPRDRHSPRSVATSLSPYRIQTQTLPAPPEGHRVMAKKKAKRATRRRPPRRPRP